MTAVSETLNPTPSLQAMDIYTVNQKNAQMFLSYLPQNLLDSYKIWYKLSRINLRYSSLNIFQLTGIMSLHYLVKISGRVL